MTTHLRAGCRRPSGVRQASAQGSKGVGSGSSQSHCGVRRTSRRARGTEETAWHGVWGPSRMRRELAQSGVGCHSLSHQSQGEQFLTVRKRSYKYGRRENYNKSMLLKWSVSGLSLFNIERYKNKYRHKGLCVCEFVCSLALS